MENNEYIKWNEDLLEHIKSIEKDNNPLAKQLLDEISSGQNILTSKIIESSYLIDSSWVDVINGFIPSLEYIVKDPQSLITDDKLAFKKKSKNDLIPGLYEKRFIKTLINDLYIFVVKRYNLVKDKTEDFRKNRVELSSEFVRGSDEVKCNIALEIKGVKDKEILETTLEAQQIKAKKIFDKITEFKKSNFMKVFDKIPELEEAVMKTNVLLNDSNYKDCFMMWIYLQRFKEEVEVPVKEKINPLDSDYKSQLIWLVVLLYAIDTANNPLHKIYEEINFKDFINEQVMKLNVVDNRVTQKLEQPFEDTFLERTEDLFVLYTNEGMSDKAAYKKILKDMIDLSTETFRKQNDIPEDTTAGFKSLVYTTDSIVTKLIKDYESKISLLKDAYKVKEADLNKLKKSIDKMEQYVADYKVYLADLKKKQKEEERLRKIEEKIRIQKEREREKEEAKKQREEQKVLESLRKAQEKEEAKKLRLKEAEAARKQKLKEKEQQKKELAKQKAKEKKKVLAKKAKKTKKKEEKKAE